MIKRIILIYFICSFLGQVSAQTFDVGIVAGLNASQINGDLIAGFNKLGIHGGLKVVTDLGEQLEGSVELLYSSRGSRASGRFADPFYIRINYVELPLIFAFKDWLKDDYYRIRFEGGFSYGRLIKSETEDVTGTFDVDNYKKNDYSWLVGASYYTSERLAFSARFTQSINLLSSEDLPTGITRLRGFFLTFRGIYFL